MRLLLLAVLGLLFGLALSGCSPDPATLTKQDERALAAETFAAIERGRSGTTDFAVPAGSDLRPGAYRGLAANLPRATPVLVGVHRLANLRGSRALLIYSLERPNDYNLVTLVMVERGGRPAVAHVNIEKLPRPLAELQRFGNADVGAGKLALLLLPLLTLGLTIAAILRIWRSGRFGHRWLWTIGSLLGLCELQILWPTARVIVQPLYISILPASLRQIGPYPDSWLIGASVPVVALIVLLIRRSRDGLSVVEGTPAHP